ncbi:hypothetical protein [Rhizosphaericola mali]|uniref:Uncharacterized protein n=1 Tax=Rhizosphaericola mali TaxID=2545455 RepID=A0A5P2G1C0_9BACT|nr:hypothetical protein [Rhizosphaericola mali]QES89594.1 hypothetical protein E0W69_013290 [Rhizosphaericola mali]
MENKKEPYHPNDLSNLENLGWESMRQMLDQQMPVQEEDKPKVIPIFWRWMAAAVILLMLGIGYYLFSGNEIEKINNKLAVQNKSHQDSSIEINKTTVINNLKQENDISDRKARSLSDNVAENQNIGQENTIARSGNLSIKNSMGNSNAELHGNSAIRLNASQFINQQDSGSVTIAMGQQRKFAKKNMVGLSAPLPANANSIDVDNGTSKLMIASTPIIHSDKIKTDKSIKEENDLASLSGNDFSKFRAKMNEAIKEDTSSSSIAKDNNEDPSKKMDSASIALNNKKLEELIKAQEENDAKEKAKQKKNVQLALLLNRNVSDKNISSGNQLYDLPVYPAVTASLKITKKIGISSGVSVSAPGNLTNGAQNTTTTYTSTLYAAPAAANNGAFTGTVITQPVAGINAVNSTTGTLKLESDNYVGAVRQAYYWQIPIMVDFFPINNLRLSAGTDLSFIQKVLVADGVSTDGSLQSLSAYNNESSYSQMRGFDPRLSIGAQYQLKKVMLGAKFSRSFQPALQFTNGILPNQNNQIFNFSLGYRLFQ